MPPSRSFPVRLPLLLSLALFLLPRGAGSQELITDLDAILSKDEESNWNLDWLSEVGHRYRIQRSVDLLLWENAATIVADGSETLYKEADVGGARVFWRLIDLGASTALGVSDPLPTFSTLGGGGGGGSVALGVTVEPDDAVRSVSFFDGGTLLGVAAPGLGGDYTLPLQTGSGEPAVMQLSVAVETEDGQIVTSAPSGLLVADPTRFVPLVGAAGAEQLAFGRFVQSDAAGVLGAFVYYPEGVGDLDSTTGAHLRFPPGARLLPGGTFEFSSAAFARGHGDGAPLASLPGIHTLDLDALGPAEVSACFQLPANGDLCLLWGEREVPWNAGNLGEGGWSALEVTPPVGEFALPGSAAGTAIKTDPRSGEPYLVASFFGDWPGVAGSKAALRVPSSDPLRIYLPRHGALSAGGSAEIVFPDGATLRGTLRWQEPNFEIHVEGKAGTLPALGALQGALPEDPLACIPEGDTTGKLDGAADCLAGYQRSFRALAVGGLGQAASDGDTFEPSPAPADPAGPALEGWAWRLQTWDGDRAGERLDADDSACLLDAIRAATRVASAAQDLPTAAKLLRDLLIVRTNIDEVIHPSVIGHAELLETAEQAMFAAAERLIEAAPEVEGFDDTARVVAGLLAAADGTPNARRDGQSEAAQRARAISQSVRAKAFARLFKANGIDGVPGFNIDNPILLAKTADQLREILDQLERYMALLQREGVTLFTPDPASGCLLLSTEVLTDFPIVQDTMLEMLHILRTKISSESRPAFDAAGAAPEDYERYKALRAAAVDYARFFLQFKRLGFPQGGDQLDPPAAELLDRFAEQSAYWDARIDPDARGSTAAANLQVAGTISLTTAEACLVEAGLPAPAYAAALRLVKSQNDELRSQITGDSACDRLRLDLQNRLGLTVPFPKTTAAFEEVIDHDIQLTGRYASVPRADGKLQTVQLSQAGRYLEGFIQTHIAGRDLQSSRLRGFLIEGSATELRFGVLRQSLEGITMAAGTLTAREDSTSGGVFLSLVETDTDGIELAISFSQTSIEAAISDRLLDLIPGEAGAILRSQQWAPLHPAELDFLRRTVEGTNPLHDTDTFTPGNQPFPLTALVRNTAIGDLNSRRNAAIVLDSTIAFIAGRVTTDHIPLVRSLVREFLSKEEVPPGGLPAGTTSYWQQLTFAYAEHFAVMPAAGAFLELGSAAGLDSSQLYQYEFNFKSVTLGIDAPAIPFVGVGAVGIEITVKKQAPDGSNNHAEPWVFVAALGQIGVGWGPLPFTLAASGDSVNITSMFDYGVEDIEGGITVLAVSATAATSVGASVGISSIIIHPEGNKPTLYLDPGNTSTVYGIQAGVGADATFGYVWEVRNGGIQISSHGIIDDLVKLNVEEDAQFGVGVSFAVDDHRLTDCGWQSLREFVAEFRHLIDGEDAEVSVLGFTDTTQPTAANDLLSERRAATVKSALSSLIGDPSIAIDDFGLGERAASQEFDTNSVIAGFESALRDLITDQRATIGTIPDDTPSAEWRQVIILVNNTVAARLSGALSND